MVLLAEKHHQSHQRLYFSTNSNHTKVVKFVKVIRGGRVISHMKKGIGANTDPSRLISNLLCSNSMARGKSLLELWVTIFLPSRLTATLNLCPIYLKLLVHVL